MQYKRFEDLPVWILSLKITKAVYDLSDNDKWRKDFGLRDQIRRAVVSISSNIVEGFEKNNNNEFIRFLRIAKGSVGEVRNQLKIALTIGHIIGNDFDKINDQLEELSKQIGGLIKYLDNFRSVNS